MTVVVSVSLPAFMHLLCCMVSHGGTFHRSNHLSCRIRSCHSTALVRELFFFFLSYLMLQLRNSSTKIQALLPHHLFFSVCDACRRSISERMQKAAGDAPSSSSLVLQNGNVFFFLSDSPRNLSPASVNLIPRKEFI